MYDFVDVVDFSNEPKRSPESFSFNGVWLEDKIEEFTVLNTSGREAVNGDIQTNDDIIRDGTAFLRRRYEPRSIKVTYMLIADDALKFRDAQNRLNALLTASQARLIFADEPDKFFIATLRAIDIDEPGSNSTTGTIEFYCTDPFKYSVSEREFLMSENPETGKYEINVQNDGAVPVPVDYDIVTNGENGMIGIASTQGVMQFGRGDTTLGKNQTMFNCTGGNFDGMAVNAGAPLGADHVQNGKFGRQVLANNGGILTPTAVSEEGLKAQTFTSSESCFHHLRLIVTPNGVKDGKLSIKYELWWDKLRPRWYVYNLSKQDRFYIKINGQSVFDQKMVHDLRRTNSQKITSGTLSVSVPSSGNVSVPVSFGFQPFRRWNGYYPGAVSGSGNYIATTSSAGTGAGTGVIDFGSNPNGWHGASLSKSVEALPNFIASATVFMHGYSYDFGDMVLAVGDESGQVLASMELFKLNWGSPWGQVRFYIKGRGLVKSVPVNFSEKTGWQTIQISKGASRIVFTFKSQRYEFDCPELLQAKGAKVMLYMGAWKSITPTTMFVNSMYCSSFTSQIQNKYYAGSHIQINGREAKFYLNGVYTPSDENMGTSYFKVPPGASVIEFLFSHGLTNVPTITAKIREAWL